MRTMGFIGGQYVGVMKLGDDSRLPTERVGARQVIDLSEADGAKLLESRWAFSDGEQLARQPSRSETAKRTVARKRIQRASWGNRWHTVSFGLSRSEWSGCGGSHRGPWWNVGVACSRRLPTAAQCVSKAWAETNDNQLHASTRFARELWSGLHTVILCLVRWSSASGFGPFMSPMNTITRSEWGPRGLTGTEPGARSRLEILPGVKETAQS